VKVGDLVGWRLISAERGDPVELGVILGKEGTNTSPNPHTPAYYWRVFVCGNVVLLDEKYLELINECR